MFEGVGELVAVGEGVDVGVNVEVPVAVPDGVVEGVLEEVRDLDGDLVGEAVIEMELVSLIDGEIDEVSEILGEKLLDDDCDASGGGGDLLPLPELDGVVDGVGVAEGV